MTEPTLLTQIEGYLSTYGQAVPELPTKPRVATYTVQLDAMLFDFAQAIVNDQRLPYGGKLQPLFRHALHLLVLALARRLKRQESGPLQWELELLAKQTEDDQFNAFVQYARDQLAEAKQKADARIVNELIQQTYSSEGRLRRRIHEWLLESRSLKEVAKKTQDERLTSWLELAI